MSLAHELEVARRIAGEAGELALKWQERDLRPEIKADDSPVTLADKECERLITAALLESFPGDGLLGEEGSDHGASAERRWIIDPIDGTRDYLRGNRLWCVLLALEAGGDTVVGVAHFPALDETYYAARGEGAFLNGQPIRISSITDPTQAVFCFNGFNRLHQAHFRDRLPEWMQQFWAVRNLGGAPDAMLVASGKAEAWIEQEAKPWDLAAVKVITEEAGGRFFNFDGGSSIYGGNCFTCVPALEPMVRRFIGL